jgi:hypothetical protein
MHVKTMRILWVAWVSIASSCAGRSAPATSTLEAQAREHYRNRQRWCAEIGATHYRNGMCYRRRPNGSVEWLNLAVGTWNTCDPAQGALPEWCTEIIAGQWNPKD